MGVGPRDGSGEVDQRQRPFVQLTVAEDHATKPIMGEVDEGPAAICERGQRLGRHQHVVGCAAFGRGAEALHEP
jgi:hypothetical protein